MEREEQISKVVFFSRGCGRGHAIPDLAIANDLLRLAPTVDLCFVSYDVGATTIRPSGYKLIDLHLPERSPFVDTLVKSCHAISSVMPSLVISHEESAALPAAKALGGLPTMFLTDWFLTYPSENEHSVSLRYADEVIFLDEPGYFEEPEVVRGRVSYVGPVLRDLHSCDGLDKQTLRRECGLPTDALVILVIPGGASISSEERTPIWELVAGAFSRLSEPNKRLLWIGGAEYDALKEKTTRSDIAILRPHIAIERLMLASDVTITKATRITCLELNALGCPSISLSYGLNPFDDQRISRIQSNTALRARGLRPEVLVEYIYRILRDNKWYSRVLRVNGDVGRALVVRSIVKRLGEITRVSCSRRVRLESGG